MRRGTIQSWLAGVVVACMLPAAATTTLVVWHFYTHERATIEAGTVLTARALAQAVDRELEEAVAAAQVLANSSRLTSVDLLGFYREAKAALPFLEADTVVLTDAEGQQVLNTFVPFGLPLPPHGNDEQLRRVHESGEPAISDLFLGGVTRQPIIAIDVPVIRDKLVVYYLSIGIIPARLAQILRSQDLPATWVAAIFDRTGTIVARTHAADQFVGHKGAAMLLDRMAEVPEGTLDTLTLEGIPVVSSFSRSKTSGWSVAIGIPLAGLTAGLRQTLWLTAIGASVILGVGAMVAKLIGHRIARSIYALSGPALALGAGQSTSAIRTDVAEINQVAQTLVNAAHERARLIREQERLAAELRRAQSLEELGRITGTVAHDFGNLLTPIAGNLDLLAHQPDDPRSARRLASARTAVDRAAAVIKSLLAFARRQPLTVGRVDANETIRGMQDLLNETLAAQAKLTLDLDPDLWPARADKTQLEMAILNLAVNARDAMTRPGTVVVSTTNVINAPGGLAGEFVRVAVQDSGSGMPPDVLARAFEPFTTKPRGKGTGLGLASIYGFAKQCGGVATIDSEQGCGTTVTIYLPREKADAAPAANAAPPRSS